MLVSLKTLRERFLPDVSERWLREQIRRGVVPVVRVAGRVLADPEDVLAELKRRAITAAESSDVDALLRRETSRNQGHAPRSR